MRKLIGPTHSLCTHRLDKMRQHHIRQKNGQGVTTLPILFKTEKITSRCNYAAHYAPAQSPRQPYRPAAQPESE